MKQVIGIGAGGHAKTVMDAIRSQHEYEIFGLLDRQKDRTGTTWMDIPIIGTDHKLRSLYEGGLIYAFIGLGGVGDLTPRKSIFNKLKQLKYTIIKVVHTSAWVSPSVKLNEGITILAKAAVNADAQLGCNVIINTGAIVEHDCRIGDHAHIAPGAVLAGNVTIEAGAFIGAGACIRQGIHIGENAIVGMGSVVVTDVPDNACVIGVPARKLENESKKGS